MKYEVKPSNRFKKDMELAKRRGYDSNLIFDVIKMLASGEILYEKYRDNSLTGYYKNFRECHITPDWLLS
ncbi:MAG: type II toxin-antitoxin system YafQ family toxin [Firmicutes bacterium]|nr:type II toxin-antitoxin system YafQ family toxin [Bacillota bacterium]